MTNAYVIVALKESPDQKGKVVHNILNGTYFAGKLLREDKWDRDINKARVFPANEVLEPYLGKKRCFLVRHEPECFPLAKGARSVIILVLLNQRYVFYFETQGFLCKGGGYILRSNPNHPDTLSYSSISYLDAADTLVALTKNLS